MVATRSGKEKIAGAASIGDRDMDTGKVKKNISEKLSLKLPSCKYNCSCSYCDKT